MGGLSACLFLLLLSKFQEQAREAPVAERASRRSQLRGRRGWDWSGRQDPDEARDTHTQARRDRHTDTDTFSHSGPTPRAPPTAQGHPDSRSQSCQSPEHSLDTHRDPGLRPHPTSPHRLCGLHTRFQKHLAQRNGFSPSKIQQSVVQIKEHGFQHSEVVFVGDDYGVGGNDESVYLSDFKFVCVDDYTKLGEALAEWL